MTIPPGAREIGDPQAEMERLAAERKAYQAPGPVTLDRAERVLALDAVMVFCKTIEDRWPDDDRLPALQALQDRLTGTP